MSRRGEASVGEQPVEADGHPEPSPGRKPPRAGCPVRFRPWPQASHTASASPPGAARRRSPRSPLPAPRLRGARRRAAAGAACRALVVDSGLVSHGDCSLFWARPELPGTVSRPSQEKCTSQCEESAAGLSVSRPKHHACGARARKTRIPADSPLFLGRNRCRGRTAFRFYPALLSKPGDLTGVRDGQEPRRAGPSAPSAPAATPEASGRGSGAAAGGPGHCPRPGSWRA